MKDNPLPEDICRKVSSPPNRLQIFHGQRMKTLWIDKLCRRSTYLVVTQDNPLAMEIGFKGAFGIVQTLREAVI